MQNFGARVVQIETKAVIALSRDDLHALFIEIGTGRAFDKEVPLIVRDIAEYGLRKGQGACPKDEGACVMTKGVHMLEQNGVQSRENQSAAQISYRCSACIDLIGLNAAASATAVDIQGTVSKKLS